MKESKKTKGSKSKKASKVEKSVAVSVDNEGVETPEEVVAEEMEVTTNINDVEVGEDTEVIETEEEAQNETEIEQEEGHMIACRFQVAF